MRISPWAGAASREHAQDAFLHEESAAATAAAAVAVGVIDTTGSCDWPGHYVYNNHSNIVYQCRPCTQCHCIVMYTMSLSCIVSIPAHLLHIQLYGVDQSVVGFGALTSGITGNGTRRVIDRLIDCD